jgi:LytS/YehU family sensor histidine kinase
MADLAPLISTFIVPFALLVAGFAAGWASREYTLDRRVPDRTVANGIAIVILLVWMLSVLTAMTTSDYSTPLGLYAIMGGVVGYFFGGEGIRSIVSP